MRTSTARSWIAVLVTGMAVTACAGSAGPTPESNAPPAPNIAAGRDPGPPRVVTLAFAGDTHFQHHVARLLVAPGVGLGPISRDLKSADVAMVNLESAITERGVPEPKELETPDARYHFRTSPAALDFLDAAGVDVVSMANNHGADYGSLGLADTLRASGTSPIAVLGVGANQQAAFTPYRTTVNETEIAFLAADASPREGASSVWAAGSVTPGIAAARAPRPRALLTAVRRASQVAEVVVVYLHWGRERQGCPTVGQRATAQALSEAGADIVVGSHAHIPLGSGWTDETYVNYGLGNFLWYHNHQSDTGVLRLRIEDGEVVADDWVPALIRPGGRPLPVRGSAAARAVDTWRDLRACTDLTSRPSGEVEASRYVAYVRPIGPALRARMASSHGDRCPMRWQDLRHVRMSYVGFDGREHFGDMVVAASYAKGIVGVFQRLFEARWPIRRMRLVDAYGGNDDRSMAANNTSAYNCRRVAGRAALSAHAYGAAIDINPVQNPYLTSSSIAPPAGRPFAAIDRSAGSPVPPGVIRAGDVVVRAFAAIGWEWGGTWSSSPDYQHFSARRSSR